MGPAEAAAAGFVLGLSAGGTCFWTCATVMAPYLVATGDEPTAVRWSTLPGALRTLLWYNLGRLGAYLSVGLVLGLAAQRVHQLPRGVHQASLLLTAAVLALALLRPHRPGSGGPCPARPRRHGGALLLGLAQGLGPCPPFIAAAALALAQGTPVTAPLLFAALFTGTALFTLPLALVEPLRRSTLLARTTRLAGLALCCHLVLSAL